MLYDLFINPRLKKKRMPKSLFSGTNEKFKNWLCIVDVKVLGYNNSIVLL